MNHRPSLSRALTAMLGRLSRLEQELQAILATTQAPTHPGPREYMRSLLGEVELLQALVATAQAPAPRRRVYPACWARRWSSGWGPCCCGASISHIDALYPRRVFAR